MTEMEAEKMSKFRTMSLPSELLKDAEQYVRKHPEKGFLSLSDFVKDSIRRQLERLEEDKE